MLQSRSSAELNDIVMEFRCVVAVSTPAEWLARENIKRLTTRSTIEGWGGCNKFVPVLGGDGTKRSPTGDIFDQSPGEMS